MNVNREIEAKKEKEKLVKFHYGNTDLMYENLKISKDIFERSNIKWCLFCGTLLGAFRDKDFVFRFIPGELGEVERQYFDWDIDFIIISNNWEKDKKSIEKGFIDKGYFIENINTPFPTTIYKNGEWIDLWVFHYNNEDKYYYLAGAPFHRKFFDILKESSIRDILCPVPNYTEEFIELFYGKNWKRHLPANAELGFGETQVLDNKELRVILCDRKSKGI